MPDIPLENIIIPPDRARRKFTRIMELAETITRLGVLQPIIVAPTDDPTLFTLVAGERRYRATLLAGLATIPTTLRENTTDIELAEIELIENTHRENISFEEEGICLAKIQELKRRTNPRWTLEDTAQLTNRSTGDVSTKIKIAKKYKERPDLRTACGDLPCSAALKKIEMIESAEKIQRLADQGQIHLTTELQHGDCRELIKNLADESVDVLVTDPPFGVEKINAIRKIGSGKPTTSSSLSGHKLMNPTHNMTLVEVKETLAALAPELYRVLKPGAHFYMFCGFEYVGDFLAALAPHLEFQPPLLVWDRGRPSSPGYGYNYLSRTEAIIYGCRPPRTRRLNQSKYNLFPCSDVPKNMRIYPTEKPVPLLMGFIENSSTPNDVVLDPFAGSASTLIAARRSGRRGIGFEIDREAYLRAQQQLIAMEGATR